MSKVARLVLGVMIIFSVAQFFSYGLNTIHANRLNLATIHLLNDSQHLAKTERLPTFSKSEFSDISSSRSLQRSWIRFLLKTGRYSKALELFGQMSSPDCVLALQVGEAYQSLGDNLAATALWSACPNTNSYFVNLGLAAEEGGRLEEARNFYLTAISIRSAVNDPTVAYYLLIRLDGKGGAWRRALPTIRTYQNGVIGGDIPNPIFTDDLKRYSDMWEFISIGHYMRVDQGSCDAAYFWYDLARQRNPDNAFPYIYMGVCEPDIDKKIDLFEQSTIVDPSNALGHYWKGVALKSTGQLAQAIASLNTAAQLAPRDINIWLQLADSYAVYKDIENAIRAYEAVLAINPNHKFARSAIEKLSKK